MEHALAERGIAVTTVTTDDDGPGRRLSAVSCATPIQGVRRIYFRKWLDFYKFAPGLQIWLWQNIAKFDVVHIHALFSFSSMAAAWAAHRAGVPYVLRPLGTLSRYGITQRRPWLKKLSLNWLEAPALRRAAVVHFTSEDEKNEANEWGVPIHGVVIPMGIETTRPSNATLIRARYPELRDDGYFLYLARLDPIKNLESLLSAFAQCRQCSLNLRLLVAGNGAPGYVASLKALSSELGISDRVVWAGHIDTELKASALAGAEFFVLPSFSESFGIAAAEALMAGKPCVLGQGVAIAQEVVNAGAGVSVAPDPASIAAGLMKVMEDKQTRAAMSVCAIALAQEKFSAQAMGENLVALYEEILRQRRTPAFEMTRISK